MQPIVRDHKIILAELQGVPGDATVLGGGHRVGFVPAPIAEVLAPSGTRAGRGVVVREWSTNGVRQDIWVLGSMHVRLSFATEDRTLAD